MTYRLLRDNTETGPYTKAQLIDKGLKPFDLIWEEGSSAAWKYPTEIEELKSLVKDHLPDGINAASKKPRYRVKAITEEIEQKSVASPVLETKYSKSLDDLKKQYEEKVLSREAGVGKKKKNSVLTPVLLSLPVLILGVIIGVIWKHDKEPTTLSSPSIEKEVVGIFDTQKTENLDDTYVLSNSSSEPVGKDSTQKDSSVSEIKVEKATSGVKEKNPGYKRSISDVVAVKASYKNTGNGIKNIKLNVSNLTYLNLDLVVLELFYVNAKNKIVEKETIYLKNIYSRERQSVDAPNGGKQTDKIRYKVTLVSAKAANMHLVSR